MGQRWTDSAHWRNDIQHIAAQTRELRARGVSRAVVVYLEADGKSWPEWRRVRGYDSANKLIVGIVDSIVAAMGGGDRIRVALTGHSGGGSFMFGYLEGRPDLPRWLQRIVFLDANYNFTPHHGPVLAEWLKVDTAHRLEVVAYDDREIMLDGKKVVSDSGGTWRATQRMLDWFAANDVRLAQDSLAGFARWRNGQVEVLRHPNPQNRILHTEMIGEINAYLHALLVGRPGYDDGRSVLGPPRAYMRWVRP
jgi:pimeloyl-ACP methyl ester carboxylesterase